MIKTHFIQSTFGKAIRQQTRSIDTGETKKILFIEHKIKEQHTEMIETDISSDSRIDGIALSNAVNKKLSELENNGHKLISITPITSGNYDFQYKETPTKNTQSYGYGYGFSYTEGLLITYDDCA